MTPLGLKRSRLSFIIPSLLGLCGIGMIGSTFMAWLVYMGTPVSGWEYMASTHPLSTQQGIHIFFRRVWGSVWFTGLWSLLFGILLVLAAYLVYRGMTAGSIISLLVGLAGSSIALFNIIASSGFEEAAETQAGIAITADLGYGLLVFLIISSLASILAAVNLVLRLRRDKALD